MENKEEALDLDSKLNNLIRKDVQIEPEKSRVTIKSPPTPVITDLLKKFRPMPKPKPKQQKNPCTSGLNQFTNVPYYTPERVIGPNLASRSSAPQYSFASDNYRYEKANKKAATTVGVGNSASCSPGPKYNIGGSTNAIKPRAPAFSIGIRTKC